MPTPTTTGFELFGDRLDCALARVGMTQTVLAQKPGTTPQKISFLICGEKRIYHGERGSEIADILQVPMLWLVHNEGLPPPDMPHPESLTAPRKQTHRRLRAQMQPASPASVSAKQERLPTPLDTTNLGFLHMAVLEKLITVMKAGELSEKESLEMLVRLEAAPTKG